MLAYDLTRTAGVQTVSAVRGVVVGAAQLAIRDLGLDARYAKAMSNGAALELQSVGVLEWIPTATAMLHYRALDEMDLSAPEIDAIAQVMSRRINGPFLRTVAAAVRAAGGISSDIFAAHVPRMWASKYMGGALLVDRLGPKDAHARFIALGELGTSRYFRAGIAKHVANGFSMFTRKCYVNQVPTPRSDELVIHFAWV